VPQLAWTLSQRFEAWVKTELIAKIVKISLHYSPCPQLKICLQEKIPFICKIWFFRYKLLAATILYCMLFARAVLAQDVSEVPIEEDPYIDPEGVSDVLQPAKRVESPLVYMFGVGYGLNPIVILAPALSFGVYWDPLVIGIEFSDSEHMGIWEKERRENFGPSRLNGNTQFLKWFYGENFYLMAAREQRSVKLWSRTFNRTDTGRATFDMFFNTTVTSLGTGLLRFNDVGFMAIDIIRFSFLQNQSVQVIEYWETWTELSGSRKKLDKNISDRTDKWFNILDSPTGFFVTVGVYF
jgi:hypothetical protein